MCYASLLLYANALLWLCMFLLNASLSMLLHVLLNALSACDYFLDYYSILSLSLSVSLCGLKPSLQTGTFPYNLMYNTTI